MKLAIRAATPEDHPFLHRLSRAAHEALATRLFGSWDDTAQRARLDRNLERYPFRIVVIDLRPVGAIASIEHEDHVFLHEMMILPELQNQGIGSTVLLLE